jgi:hypothetical protein
VAGRKETAYFDQAERLYVVEGKTFAQIIAALVGQVSERSLSNWKEKGGWEAKRRQFMASQRDPLAIAREVQVSLMEAIDGRRQAEDYVTAAKLLNGLGQVNATIRRLESQQYDKRAICLEAMRHFVDWLKSESPIKADPDDLSGQERLIGGFLQYLERA